MACYIGIELCPSPQLASWRHLSLLECQHLEAGACVCLPYIQLCCQGSNLYRVPFKDPFDLIRTYFSCCISCTLFCILCFSQIKWLVLPSHFICFSLALSASPDSSQFKLWSSFLKLLLHDCCPQASIQSSQAHSFWCCHNNFHSYMLLCQHYWVSCIMLILLRDAQLKFIYPLSILWTTESSSNKPWNTFPECMNELNSPTLGQVNYLEK